jgi:hypothetical protein
VVFWSNDRSTLELDLRPSRRATQLVATAVVRACRPTTATRSRPNGCIRMSRADAPDPLLTVGLASPTTAMQRQPPLVACRRTHGPVQEGEIVLCPEAERPRDFATNARRALPGGRSVQQSKLDSHGLARLWQRLSAIPALLCATPRRPLRRPQKEAGIEGSKHRCRAWRTDFLGCA